MIFQYVVLLVGTALFLFNMAFFDDHMIEKLLIASIIIYSTVCFGALFEQKSWSKFGEIARLLMVIGATYFFVIGFDVINPMVISACLSYLGLSIVWLKRATNLSSPAIS